MPGLHAALEPLSGEAPAAGGPPLISGENLVVRYGRRTVLDKVSITVGSGEIVSLIGPNGAGKSTLVRALLRLIKPDGGTVRQTPGLKVGYVPQRIEAHPLLPVTVHRFLTLARRRRRKDILAALDEVGAADTIDRQLHDLSGGEFRRVTLARALLRDPDLLVLDEPSDHVDFRGRLALGRLIGALRDRRGCGILIISHDLHLVLGATDRVVCINGHVCCTGRPDAVSRHPNYISLFGPEAAAALAVYTHSHDHSHDIAGRVVPLEMGENAETTAAGDRR